eukprot:TRINITY_DN5054_c0_g1_i1.p1 TRINITY_DN5054_c0_g1~~TRINITY_DN5054_c0_g1_i1.p1  ORF type:complete len:1065 (-),score=412.46 TRINITY_DN5054_c0_g1_i1:53-2818(-)
MAKDAADKVADAARSGDPKRTEDALRDLNEPLDDLRRRAKDLARKEQDPLKRQRLLDLLDALDDVLPEFQDAARNLAKNPNDPKAQKRFEDALNDLNDALDDIADEANPAHKRKGDKDFAKAANEFGDNLPQLEQAINRLRDNPNDPAARKALEDLLDGLEDSAGDLIDLYRPRDRPGDAVARAARDLGDDLDDLEAAARRGDQPGVDEAAKRAKNHEDGLADALRDLADNPRTDAKDRKRLLDALNDLEKLLPDNISAARNVASNPNDPAARRALGDANEDAHDALDRIGKVADPPRESGMKNAADDARQAAKDLQDAAKRGDQPKGKKANDDLDDALRDLLDRGYDDLARTDPNADPKRRKALEDALAALEDLLPRMRDDGQDALNNPRDANKQNTLGKDADEMNKALDDLLDAARVPPLSKAQDADRTIDDLAAAAAHNKPKDVAAATKDLAQILPDLLRDAKKENDPNRIEDPQRRKNLLDHISELEQLMPKLVPTVKAALVSPDDSRKQDDLQNLLDNMQTPIAQLQNDIKPTKGGDADGAARDIGDALRKIGDAADRGDRPGTDKALKDLKDGPLRDLQDLGRQAAKDTTDPNRRKDLQDAIDALDKLLADLEKAARESAANPNDKAKKDALDDISHQFQDGADKIADLVKDEEDVNADVKKRAAIVLASMKGAKKRSMDPRTLLEAADALAKNLQAMMGDAKIGAYANPATTDRAKKALDLNDLLNQMDAAAKGTSSSRAPPKQESLDGLMQGLSQLADAAVPAAGASLEDSLEHWARAIQHRSQGLKGPSSATTSDIGAELAKLAQAAREGRKTDFLVSARTISVLINTYNKELRQLASSCSDPELRDRLVQNGQALKNFSIQLKIMASVKAASTGNDSSAETQLATLAGNFGQMLHATMNNVHVYQIKSLYH